MEESYNNLETSMASKLHEEWRNGWRKQNDGKVVPRMKGTEDINVPFTELTPKWQEDNLKAAKAAYEAVTKFPDNRELGSNYIHEKWLERNGIWAPPEQKVPYEELSEIEKDKDRLHYDMMKEEMMNGDSKNLGGRKRRRSMKKRKSIKRRYRTRRNKNTNNKSKKTRNKNTK